jgi:hypothetical protein
MPQLHNIFNLPPIYDDPIKDTGKFHQNWQGWLNSIHSFIGSHNYHSVRCHTINPDFHWARVKKTYDVSSLTRVGSTVTATVASTATLETGMSVTIAGAVQTEYNGTFIVTVINPTQFTYTISGTPVTPATGTITATWIPTYHTEDGEFMDKWWAKSNGNTFKITPTIYTDSYPSSETGSKHYAHVEVTSPTSNDFEIYQKFPNYTSRFQNKKLASHSIIHNNGSNRFKMRYYVGFDTNTDGTDEHFLRGKSLLLKPGLNYLNDLLEIPRVESHNQNTLVTLKLLATDLTDPIDFNMYAGKFEDGIKSTALFVDHTLEKLKIDNE